MELILIIIIIWALIALFKNKTEYKPISPRSYSHNYHNKQLGKMLKKQAKPSGNLVFVEIQNVYNTLDTLATFFYQKKHEWIAICFFDEQFTCKLIWFNKGENRSKVTLELSIDNAINIASQHNCRYIIAVHNHPLSSFDIPDLGSRRANIYASYAQKEAISYFSDTDMKTYHLWEESCCEKQIGYADVLLVAGDIKIIGNSELIANFSENR
jgi:hypothetical protein